MGKGGAKGNTEVEERGVLRMNTIKYMTYLHKNLFMKHVAKYMDIHQLIFVKKKHRLNCH